MQRKCDGIWYLIKWWGPSMMHQHHNDMDMIQSNLISALQRDMSLFVNCEWEVCDWMILSVLSWLWESKTMTHQCATNVMYDECLRIYVLPWVLNGGRDGGMVMSIEEWEREGNTKRNFSKHGFASASFSVTPSIRTSPPFFTRWYLVLQTFFVLNMIIVSTS